MTHLLYRNVTCHVMSCHDMPYHVMSCHVMGHVMSWHEMTCHESCHVMSCHDIPCYVIMWHVMWCHVMTCPVMSCHVMSWVMSCHVVFKIMENASQGGLLFLTMNGRPGATISRQKKHPYDAFCMILNTIGKVGTRHSGKSIPEVSRVPPRGPPESLEPDFPW